MRSLRLQFTLSQFKSPRTRYQVTAWTTFLCATQPRIVQDMLQTASKRGLLAASCRSAMMPAILATCALPFRSRVGDHSRWSGEFC